MTTYIWMVKDARGNRVTREVPAETSAESEAILRRQGYTDLELVQDEVGAAVLAGFPGSVSVFGEKIEATAGQRAAYMGARPPSLGQRVGHFLRGQLWLLLLAVIIGAIEAGNDYSWSQLWNAVEWIVIAVVVTGLALTSLGYKRLIKAADWNRWPDVLSWVKRLHWIGMFCVIKIPPTELTRNRAKALAGMGQLEEALREFAPCENRRDCPRWLYLASLAGIHDTARQYDRAIALTRQSLAEKPTAACYIDLANRYARYKRDPVQARAALAEADKSPLPPLAATFRLRCLGFMEYLEGDFGAALRDLTAAIHAMEQNRKLMFRDGLISVAKAYRCCVLARQGNLEAARENYWAAKAYLEATGETQLLAECNRLLGQPG